MRYAFAGLVASFLVAAAFAQPGSGEATKAPKNGISTMHMKDLAKEREILVYFTGPTAGLPSDIAPGQISIRFLPSKTVVPQVSIAPGDTHFSAPFGNSVLQIGLVFDDTTKPGPKDTQVEVTLAGIHFTPAMAVPLAGTGTIYNKSNIQDLVDLTKKALSSAKPSSEKDEFLSLAVTIPGAPAAPAVGSTDINFNRDVYSADLTKPAQHLFDSASVGFALKKSNSDATDARHFEAGLRFRKTVLLANRAALATIRSSIASGSTTPDAATLGALSKLQQAFVRGIIVDNGGYFEGDAKGLKLSNVSNAVYNVQAQVVSVARALGNRTGFWSFRVMPAGFELGHNITAGQTANAERGSLARYKAGGQFNLHYQAADSSRRIEFEALTAERVLFKNENGVDAKNHIVAVPTGGHNWTEASLRFYFGPVILKHRVGAKVDYQRGSLPPVYAFVKTFTYGVVFESTDDDTSQ